MTDPNTEVLIDETARTIQFIEITLKSPALENIFKPEDVGIVKGWMFVSAQLYDMKEGARRVWHIRSKKIVYPEGLEYEAGLPATDLPRAELRQAMLEKAGETIGKAFDDLYYFERACETYITALMTGKPLRTVSDEVAEKTAQQWHDYVHRVGLGEAFLSEIRVILDREEPDYKL